MTKFDIWKTVLIILVLNIILPTADIVTDLRLIEKLYRGVHMCSDGTWEIWSPCNDPITLPKRTDSDSQYYCRYVHPKDWDRKYLAYWRCEKEGPKTFCSDPSRNNVDICGKHVTHRMMATAMFIPFCLNYIFCFITFFRLGTDKKKTFIFPLLNLYPQFGN